MSDNAAFNSLFAPEQDGNNEPSKAPPWKVLLVDDEPDVHAVMRLALAQLDVEGRSIEILEAFSSFEARRILAQQADIALILLDVVMESHEAGLELVETIRNRLNNNDVQVIVVTGQPGYAPQLDVIREYDINGYLLKTELSNEKITSVVVSSLRTFRLIQELQQERNKLAQSEKRYFDLYENSPDMYGSVDAVTTRVKHCNQTLANKLGLSKEQIIGQPLFALYHEDSQASARLAFQSFLKTGVVTNAELQLKRADGSKLDVNLNVTAVRDDNGKILYSRSCWVDISERKKIEMQMQLAAKVFSHASEGITITDAAANILNTNEAFSRITGYSREEVIGKNPRVLQSGRHKKDYYEKMWETLLNEGQWRGEIWNRRKNGEVYAELLTINAVKDNKGEIQNFVALFSDITAQKQHQKQLEHIAHFDALTDLPNRTLLADRIEQSMAQELRRNQQLAVVFLDLDQFKGINDIHGHHVGDRLLVEISNRLKSSLRDGDTIARIGGDEFVIVLNDLSEQMDCIPIVDRLVEAAASKVILDGRELQVSASLGITFYPQDEEIDADQLLRQADQAMYQAKLTGKNGYQFFDAEQDQSIRDQHGRLQRIAQALADDEFVLYYQPKINMRNREMTGVETLIRWNHPEQGILPPFTFLPAIDEHPLAIEIGNWVLETAVAQLDSWRKAGLETSISVNVGPDQLEQPDFVQKLQAIFGRFPELDISRLELEILETSALNDIDLVSRVIRECREIGVSFALDDFGTGYSSLTYLKRLPVSTLKIDQSFVRDMLETPDDVMILKGIIALAHAFGHNVIAEGVETSGHVNMLLEMGCEHGQGYLFARPMPAGDIIKWLKANK